MAWRCRFVTARSQDGRVVAEHPTHWLISTQVATARQEDEEEVEAEEGLARRAEGAGAATDVVRLCENVQSVRRVRVP